MKTFGLTLLILIGGYTIGFALGMAAVYLFSPNQHDIATEAAMTGAFVAGPAIALLSVVGFAVLRLLR